MYSAGTGALLLRYMSRVLPGRVLSARWCLPFGAPWRRRSAKAGRAASHAHMFTFRLEFRVNGSYLSQLP